jgi:hypothetical protein
MFVPPAAAASFVIIPFSAAAVSAVLVMSSLTAAMGKLFNLFHDFFKHVLPLFIII